MSHLSRCALIAAAFFVSGTGITLAQATPAPLATAAPSLPATIFQASYRQAIDSRCPKARAGADLIAENIDGVDLPVLAATEKELMDCSRLPRLPQAKDQTIYLQLAAGTAFYLIATRTTGATQKSALTYARQVVTFLTPDVDRRQENAGAGDSKGGGGSNSGLTGMVANNAVHVNETVDPDGFGSSYDPAMLRRLAAELSPLIDRLAAGFPK